MGPAGQASQATTTAPRRADAGTARLGGRDVARLVLAAVVLGVVAARAGASGPATAGVVTGLGVWLVLTARGDLAPPPGR